MAVARATAPATTVSLRVVGGLVQAVEQAGVPRAALLRAMHLDAAQLGAEEARMPGGRARARLRRHDHLPWRVQARGGHHAEQVSLRLGDAR